jgi:hypothetical protein
MGLQSDMSLFSRFLAFSLQAEVDYRCPIKALRGKSPLIYQESARVFGSEPA